MSKSDKRTGKWTKEEDELLLNAVQQYGTKNWKLVSKAVEGRNQVQCLHRWTKILQPGLTKGPWSIAEDRKLLEWVQKEGPNKWTACAEYIKGRSGKQCRERWLNTLNPGVKKGNWEAEEDYLIFKLFTQFGSQWSKINLYFERRTENSIKNRFYSTLRRIAAEKRKESSVSESTCELSSSTTKTKLDSLLKYIPDAIKEKALKLYKKNSNHELLANTNVNNIIDFTHSHNHNDNDINSPQEDIPQCEPYNKIIQSEDDSEMKEQHPKSIEYMNENSFFPEDNICFLDNEISNFLDNYFESNDKNCNLTFIHNSEEKMESDETESNLNVNSVNIHDSNLIVQQLSSLEELLQNTKKQILSGSAFTEPLITK
jgi:hypothetical protein